MQRKDLPISLLADTFNNFFSEKIVNMRKSISRTEKEPDYSTYHDLQNLSSFGQITGADLVSVLRSMKLKPNKLDIIPSWLLKTSSETLIPVLVCIVNCALSQGLPLSCKHATVTPILKSSSADPNDMKNYRPVSNFPTIVKIIERVVASKIMSHLQKNALYDPYQSAYRENHSCETVVLSALNEAYCAVDRREISIIALLDMSAAFDTIDHGLLIKKLEAMGVRDEAIRWINSYLSERYFSTCINDHKSNPLPLEMGVPQGSVLGPLLFTIYVKDLGDLIKTTGMRYHCYADDVQLQTQVPSTRFPDGITAINDCIAKIKDWTSANYLQLNDTKTELIAVGTKEQLAKVKENSFNISGSEMIPKQVVRNLGVLIDCNLKFAHHVGTISKKAYTNLRSISRLRSCLTSRETTTLVHALVLSQINTSLAVLFGIEDTQIRKLQRIEKSAFRLIFKLKRTEKVSRKMEIMGWLTVKEKQNFAT
jgi:hypothetical protein